MNEQQELEVLLESLNQPDKRQIRKGADALIALAPQRPDLAQRLEGLLATTEEKKCWPIAYILGHLPHPSELCLKVLLDTLNHDDPDIRWAVTLLLVRMGKSDPGIVQPMLDLLQHGTSTQRRMVVYCLREVDPNGTVFLRAFWLAVHDAEPLVRVAAVTSLKAPFEVGQKGLDSLIAILLHDRDSRVQCAAAIALARLREPADTICAALEEALHSDNLQLQKACRTALELVRKKEPVPPTR